MQKKQRLLYMQVSNPTVFSSLVSCTHIEPVHGDRPEIIADELQWPYNSVHEAMCDGWQVVQFPQFRAVFDDNEIDMLGYEFILQKIEDFE